MTTRTLIPKPTKPARPRAQRTSLCEDVARGFRPLQTGEQRVNREAGVIRGVKVLGLESPSHNRRYTIEAIRQGAPLYEGVRVFPNHPDVKDIRKHRSVTEAFGWLENVQPGADGLYADLRIVNPQDPSQIAKDLFWLAENKPDFFAFSHNADGEGPTDPRTGVVTIERILEVRSVDLVMEGATTTSLFESENTVPQTTLRQLIEASPAKAKTTWLSLLEDDMPLADLPMDPPPEPAAEPAAAADGNSLLAQAIAAFVMSGSEPDHDMATKLLKLTKPESATPSAETTTEEEDEDKDKDDAEEKPKMESRKSAKPAPDTLTLTEAKSLCKLAGLTEDAGLLTMLDGAPRAKALSLLEWAKGKAAPPAKTTVRSQGPGTFDPAADDESLYRSAVQRLTGREPVSQRN